MDAFAERLLEEYEAGDRDAGLATLLLAYGPEALEDEDVQPAREYLQAAWLRLRETDVEFLELEQKAHVAELNAKLREA